MDPSKKAKMKRVVQKAGIVAVWAVGCLAAGVAVVFVLMALSKSGKPIVSSKSEPATTIVIGEDGRGVAHLRVEFQVDDPLALDITALEALVKRLRDGLQKPSEETLKTTIVVPKPDVQLALAPEKPPAAVVRTRTPTVTEPIPIPEPIRQTKPDRKVVTAPPQRNQQRQTIYIAPPRYFQYPTYCYPY